MPGLRIPERRVRVIDVCETKDAAANAKVVLLARRRQRELAAEEIDGRMENAILHRVRMPLDKRVQPKEEVKVVGSQTERGGDDLRTSLPIAVLIRVRKLSRVVKRIADFKCSECRVSTKPAELGMIAEEHRSKVERTERRLDEVKACIRRLRACRSCRPCRHTDRLRLPARVRQCVREQDLSTCSARRSRSPPHVTELGHWRSCRDHRSHERHRNRTPVNTQLESGDTANHLGNGHER